jgi:hypothetical protein
MKKTLIAAAALALVSTPCFAQANPPPSMQAGIWSAHYYAPNACGIEGSTGGYTVGLFAATDKPVFVLSVNGPFAPGTQASATLYYGAGLSQQLTGFYSKANQQIVFGLSNQSINNFATFLHGFTAGVTMSVVIGSTAVDFSLAGTSAVVGALGQCTDQLGINDLPAPWAPASASTPAQDGVTVLPSYQAAPPPPPPAPVMVQPEAPTPAPEQDATQTDDDQNPPMGSDLYWVNVGKNVAEAASCGLISYTQAVDALSGLLNSFGYRYSSPSNVHDDLVSGRDQGASEANEPGVCNNFDQSVLNSIRQAAIANEGG